MKGLLLPVWGMLTLSVFVAAQACCDDYKLRVGSLSGRMDFGFDAAADVDFDWDMRFDFGWDWSGWAGISAATEANLDFDWTGAGSFRTRINGDVDDDGVDEKVRLIAVAKDDPSDPDRVYATWKGDEYSFDQGICYLLWWEGRRIELLSARCDESEPALHCSMTWGNESSLSCDVCNDAGACMQCGTDQTIADCVRAGEEELPDEPEPSNTEGGSAGRPGVVGDAGREAAGGSSSSAGAGGTSASFAGTAGAEVSIAGAGGTKTGIRPTGGTAGGSIVDGGIDVSVEWSTCVEQVAWLTSEARDCDMAEPRDDDTLCSERLSEVNLCYLAVEAAVQTGGFITSPCRVLDENITCGGLFP